MPRAVKRRALVRGDGVRVWEEDDVVRPLPKQLRVVGGAGAGPEDADRLVAHLPAVAVRAVQEIAAPALAGAGDVRQLVVGAGRDQDPPALQPRAARKAER